MKVVERPVQLEDDKVYQLVNARRSRGGIVPRERLRGRDIKTKAQYLVRAGDFVIANRQIIHGGCGIVPAELDGALVSGEYTVLQPKEGLYLPWLAFYAHTIHFQQACFHASVGVDVEKMVFKLDWWLRHELHLPPLSEQRRITEILSVWDHSIRQVERMTAAKQSRKNGLMQQLLAGKQRLPGFKGAWVRRSLADVAEVKFSSVDKNSVAGEIPVRLCNYTDVYYGHRITADMDFMKATATGAEIAEFGLQKGDVIVTKDSETADDIGVAACVSEALKGVVCGYHLALLRPRRGKAVGPFLAKLLALQTVRHLLSRMANGAIRYGLPLKDLRTMVLCLPAVEEQAAVAEVLDQAEEEERTLALYGAKLAEQKKGLMQKLLTGVARVKV